MKRKLTLVVCVIALLALIFTLASCGGNNDGDKSHTHTYAQEWSSSEVGHWYAATCGCQGEISNYGAHVDENNDGICDKCKYQICAHSYADAWTSDAENHWKAPTCGHDVVAEKGAHVDANKDGNCDTCAYVVCAHTYATAWTSDATNHWHAATCGCDVKKDVAAHVDAVLDGKCDVCSYVICAHVDADKDGNCDDCDYVVCAHTYADVWSSDENNHWHAANCGCNVANKDVAAHVDADKDGICDVCAYVVCTHEFDKTTYATSGSHHWFAATCGCNVKDSYEEHVDADNNGVCDVCEAEICAHTYADTKTWDATGHWYAATCGCDVKKDYEEHTYATEWSKDELGHWYATTCGCDVQGSFAAHDDTVFDGVCDVCAYVICAHDDANKDGICDNCTYVMCTHTFADTWSSDENNHWYAATCGCNVRKDEAAHEEGLECSVCGRSSEIKNAIDNLNSEAYLDVNSSVIIKDGDKENSYKVYDNYVVVKDTFGNVKYFAFYGEDDDLLFVINVDEDGNVTRDLYAEDVATLMDVVYYSAVYYNVSANNNEDFIKGLYTLGVTGGFDWDNNQIGFSYGFNGKETDGTFAFSYLYVEDGNYYYVEASFTVDAATNGVATANVLIKKYSDGVTVDDVTDTYVIDENATVSSEESYEIAQTFGGAMDSTTAPNPYNPDDYIVDDYTITFNGTEVKDGDTIEVVAGENIVFNFGADVLDMIKYNSIVASATNSNGDELPEWWSTMGSISVSNYADERPITFVANVADTYTVVVSVEGVETTFNVKVSYKAPTAIDSVVYDEFADEKVKANNWTIYFGQSLTFSAAVEAGCDPSFTAALGANAMAVLKDNGDGTWTIKPVMIGEYEVTLTSTVDANVTTTLTVSVVEAPAISDIISGTVSSEYLEYMTWTSGTITVVFTPASEGATEGTLTITNVGSDYSGTSFSYSTSYTYVYNSETGAIELTYVSGDETEIELSVTNYKVCALYMWETLILTEEIDEPDEPVVVGPTTSPFDMVISDTYGYFEEDEFTFVAGGAGKYTFFVPAGYGMLVNLSSEKCNYFDNTSGTSFTLTLAAGETVSLIPQATTKGTVTITFTYEATEVEEPTVEPGLTGTYTGVDGWNNEITVVVTSTTITFQPPRSQMIEFTYEVDNGIVTLYLNGEAITNPLGGNITIDTENNVFAVLSYNGTDYTLTKTSSDSGEDEPTVEGIAGTYEAADNWGNTFAVVISDSTISFTTLNGKEIVYNYTYADGVASYTDTNGSPVTMAMMFSLTITDGKVTGMTYNGTGYNLTVLGGGEEPEEPEEPADIELVLGENEVPVTGDNSQMTVVTFTATQDGTYKFTAGEGVVILYDYAPTLEFETLTIVATAGQVITLEVNDMYYNAGYSIVTVVFEGAEEPEVKVLEEGENTVTLLESQLENGVRYEFTATKTGMYTFASNDLLAIFFNENGMQIGRAQIALEAGQKITVNLVCFAMEAGTYAVTVSVEAEDDVEEPAESLAGTYEAADNWGNTFAVIITEDTISFTTLNGKDVVYNYTYADGVASYTDTDGNPVTMAMMFSLTITDGKVTGMTYNGTGYNLTVIGGGEEPEEPAGNELVLGENEVPVTGDNSQMTEVTFTATEAGNYTFLAGDSVVIEYTGGYTLEYESVTFTLEAGETITLYVNNMYFTAGTGFVTVSYAADDGEDDEASLVIGSNTIDYTAVDMDAGAKEYTFYALVNGQYTFASNDVGARVYENGMMLGTGSVHLEAGKTYTVVVFAMAEGTYTLNITAVEDQIGGGDDEEETGTEANPTVWDEIPSEVTINSDTFNKVYYTFTATQTGTLTITYPTADSWADLFEIIDGAVNGQNSQSVYETLTVEFAIEAGKTYRLGIGTWWNAGEFTLPISFTEGEIGGGDEPEEPTVDPQAELKALLSNFGYNIGDYTVTLTQDWDTGVYYIEVTDSEWTIDICFTYSVTDNGDGTFTLGNLEYYQVMWEAGLDSLDTVIAAIEGQAISANLLNNLVLGEHYINGYVVVLSREEGTGKYVANICDESWSVVDLYFTFEVVDNGDGTFTLDLTFDYAFVGEENVDAILAMDWMIGEAEDDEEPEDGDPFKDSLYGFYSTGSYELFFLNSEGTYLANVYGDGFDMYFAYEVVDNGDGTYSVSLTYFARPDFENYNADKIAAIEATVFGLTKNEEDAWVFTDGTESDEEEDPSEDEINNSLLNGTWQLVDQMTGEVGLQFVFEDGIITATDFTGGQFNVDERYDYEYNVTQGIITVNGDDTNMFTLDMGGNIVYGFRFTLTKVENGGNEPEEPASGVIVEGLITVEIGEDQLVDGVDYAYVAPTTGTYTVTSEDVMAIFLDAEGVQIGRGQVSLTEGQEVTIKLVSLDGAGAFTATLTIEAA